MHVSARFVVSCKIVNGSQMILIAGPYRSGTGDDPLRMAQNLARQRGIPVYHDIEEIPGYQAPSP
jgi:hypothetical protein